MPQNTLSDVRIVANARAKQLATKATQDRLHNAIYQALEDGLEDQSGAGFYAEFSSMLSNYLEVAKGVNTVFAQEEAANIGYSMGYPIRFNKTAVQLEMVKTWVDSREDDIVSDLQNYVLHNGLNNEVSPFELPTLAAPSSSAYWGNENSSVSTVLLYSASHSLQVAPEKNQLAGAATFYPFLSKDYRLEEGTEDNIFSYNDGVLLFGNYQLGGHRYFSNDHLAMGQFLFAPEDCTSAVAKATGLTETQLAGVWTGSLKEAYKNADHEYGYQAITSSVDGESLDFSKIEQGDIVLVGGHTAIIVDIDNQGNITSFEFNRDIDRAENKMLGGGVNQRNLIEDVDAGKEVYIMRSSQEPLRESISLADLLVRVDSAYNENDYASSGVDVQGDCSVFLAGIDVGAEDLGIE